MGRPPFDPKKMQGVVRAPASGGDAPLSVSRLATLIAGAVESGVPASVRVLGEVSGARKSTHLYFTLKDAQAAIGAVIFAGVLRKMTDPPTDGCQVIVTGRVQYYAPQGRVTLVATKVESVGVGVIDARLRALCDELRALGWLDPARKRPLPTFPRRVGVVTSPTGAALQDVLVTMRRRCPAVGVLVAPVRVQGTDAVSEIVRAIEDLSRRHDALGIDAVLLTRGGGSAEDLAAFNDRRIAEAIVRCRVPLVAAIGHEVDTTIAELVADERCASPTQAAMRLTPDREALRAQTRMMASRLGALAHQQLRSESRRLVACERHPVFSDPREVVRVAGEDVDSLAERLATAGERAIDHGRARAARMSLELERRRPGEAVAEARGRLRGAGVGLIRVIGTGVRARRAAVAGLRARLEGVGPGSVLARGFTYTLLPDGSVLRRVEQARAGVRIRTVVSDGQVESDVVGAGKGPTGGRRPRPSPGAGQLDLYGGCE